MLVNDPAHDEKQHQIQIKPRMVDIERDELPCIDDPDEIARKIADKGRGDRTVNAEFHDQDAVEREVQDRGNEARIQAFLRLLGNGVDAGKELIEAHHQHGDDQHRRIGVGHCVGRVLVCRDQEARERDIECNDKARREEQHRGIRIIDLRIEPRAPLLVVLGDRAHIPRLIKNGRDH